MISDTANGTIHLRDTGSQMSRLDLRSSTDGQDLGLSVVIHNDLSVPNDFENYTSAFIAYLQNEEATRRDSLYIVLPITVIYIVIFFTGVVGNVSTCVVIARNKSMHTATNYYLFSLAVSDLLLLVSGLPPEMYYIWSHFPYVFGEVFCIIQSFAAETSANATVLTITAFTVERYVAICHPFISHTMSKLSRAVKFVVVIWLLALCLAVPQAIQYGVVYDHRNGSEILDSARCSRKCIIIKHAFEISTMLFFVLPMTIITVLYVLIAIKLRRSRLLTATVKRNHLPVGLTHNGDNGRGKTAAQRNVIRMLVAVVMAFFICWAPFHAQRLLAVYAGSSNGEPEDALVIVYDILTYVSGVFYYLSTTVNPLLYNIMSNKFREAFKTMLYNHCGRNWSSRKSIARHPIYSSLPMYPRPTARRLDHRQVSRAVSVSDDNEKPTSIAQSTNLSELNVLPIRKVDGDQQVTKGNEINCGEYGRSIPRVSSFSQLILITSISKTFNEGNNNVLLRIQGPPKAITISNCWFLKMELADRRIGLLEDSPRFDTKGVCSRQQKIMLIPTTKSELATALPPRIQTYRSIESANTISNSSLQDFDGTEFTGTELAQYMGELNYKLVA